MTYDAHVDTVEREAGALADALGAGPPDARVATCPDWTVRDLARHVGEFTCFWTHVVCEATGRPKTPYDPEPPGEPAGIEQWYRELARHLVAALRATNAEQPSWTWVPTHQHVGFIARRCANEIVVHRFDAESARGACAALDPDAAAECVEEIPSLGAGWDEYVPRGRGQRLHLCATDSGHEFVFTMTPQGLELTREHVEDADLTLRGTMSDLLLVVYDRAPLGTVERTGDEATLDAWYQEFHFG